jgi:hypothetical protein
MLYANLLQSVQDLDFEVLMRDFEWRCSSQPRRSLSDFWITHSCSVD